LLTDPEQALGTDQVMTCLLALGPLIRPAPGQPSVTQLLSETVPLTETNAITTTVTPVPMTETDSAVLFNNKVFLPLVAAEQ